MPSSSLFAALALLTTFATSAPIAVAQGGVHAKATLYARADGDDVKVLVEIRVDPGWHIYHGPTAKEMGPPEAVGVPTSFKFLGEGFTIGPPRFPEPIREEQDFGETKTWILEHVGTPRFWFRGRKTAGADLTKLQVKVDGQTCDLGGCVPYNETVTSSGTGTDKLFAKFPADLVFAAPAADGAPLAASPEAQLGGAHAHATLFARADGDDVKVAVQIAIDPGWHVYHGPANSDVGPGNPPLGSPTRVTLLGEGVRFGAPRFPAPKRIEEPSLNSYAFEHSGTIVVWLRGRSSAGADVAKLQAKVDGQTCDAKSCDPYEQTVASAGRGPDELFAKFPADLTADAPAPAANAGAAATDLTAMPLWKFLGLAVAWAVLSLLMPCTYPMIPITISFFTKQASQQHRSGLSLSLCYGAGIVLSFVVIGVVFAQGIQAFAADGWVNLVFGLVFVVFGLSLLGLFLLQPPQFLLGAATAATRKGGYLGVFLMGATLCVTSFTCTAPFVGNLLAVATRGGDRFRVVLGMSTFGFVMAVPFVFLSLLPAKAKSLPKSGEWLHVLKVALGFIEIAAAVKFLSNCDLVWNWHVLSRELVLVLWAGILAAAAFYVWGVFTLKEDAEIRGEGQHGIGPGRLVSGLVLFLFAAYFGLGVAGTELDATTESLLPYYSKPFTSLGSAPAANGTVKTGPTAAGDVFIDDYAAALAKAKAEHKLLAIDFTGFACVNCRRMENAVGKDANVKAELENFVELWIHSDHPTMGEENRALQTRLMKFVSLPYWVVVDPKTETNLRQQEQTLDPGVFLRFLRGK